MRSDENVEQEIARGESSRTPFLALSGVSVVIGACFALALVIAVVAYLLAR